MAIALETTLMLTRHWVMPGWPSVEAPSLLATLMLLIGIPVIIGIIVSVLTLGPAWAKRNRQENADSGLALDS